MTTDPSGDAPAPDVIQGFDEIGRPVEIGVAQWAAEIYPMLVAQNWSNADQLAALVGRAIELGEATRAVEGADRLVDIDTDRERAFLVHAALHRALGDLDAAEATLDTYVEGAGPSGKVVTALARIYDDRGDRDDARLLLRRALTLDPNQAEGVALWVDWARRDALGDVSRATGGNGSVGDADAQRDAVRAALEEIATEDGAWRAPMMLGALAAAGGDIDTALDRYDRALDVADADPGADTTDLLLQVSGDLGNAGRIDEAVARVDGRYDPAVHTAAVGLNLARALLAAGRPEDAAVVVAPIVRASAPMVPDDVTAAERAVADALQTARQNAFAQAGTPISFLAVEGAMWQSGLAGPTWTTPEASDGSDDVIAVMALAATTGGDAGPIGALCRGIPLLWSDVLGQRVAARVRTVVPCVPGLGPVVVPEPWEVGQLLDGSPAAGARWLVVGTLEGDADAPVVRVEVHDCGTAADATPTLAGTFTCDATDAPGVEGAERIVATLVDAGARAVEPGTDWTAPPPELDARYRRALDDGATLAMVAEGVMPTDAVWGLSDALRNVFELGDLLAESVATHGMAVSMVLGAAHKDLAGAQQFLQALYRRHVDPDERARVPERALLSPLVLRTLGDTDGFDASVGSDPVRDRIARDERYARWVAQFRTGDGNGEGNEDGNEDGNGDA